MRFLLLILLFALTKVGYSQKLIGDSLNHKSAYKIKRMAKQSLRYNDTYSAIELYELYLTKKPKRSDIKYELAQLRQQVRDYNVALDLYKEVTQSDTSNFPKAWFYRGQCEKHLKQYDAASVSFEIFEDNYRGLKDRTTFRRLAMAEKSGIALADSMWNNPAPALVKPIATINKKHTESSPLFLSDSLMLFVSMSEDILPIIDFEDTLSSIPKMKLFQSTLENGNWSAPSLLESEINDPEMHITNPVVGPNGRYLYYNVCSENWQGKTICKIYQSRLVNGKWKRPEEMKFGINELGYTSTQPAVGIEPSKNRTILYFISDRPGGKGGLDLYYTRYNVRNEEWSKPRNVGRKINTAGNEETPWYDMQNGTLYFSSNGHPGIGGMDIYSSTGEMSKWSEPELLKVPINSAADDLYFRKQPRDRYQILVSNREGSQSLWNSTCCDDIFEVFYPSSVEMMLRITANEISKSDDPNLEPLLATKAVTKVYLFDPKSGEKYFIKSNSMINGTSDLTLEPGKIYLVEVEKPGFFTTSELVDTRKNQINDTIETELSITPWDDQPITLPNIYFEFGSSEMTAESKSAVDTTILQLLKENPRIMVEIGAHTDSKGADELNMKLSEKRAKSIAKYLQSKGIEEGRLAGVGYGETMPIAPNSNPDGTDNPEGRAKNRRVDFKVTGTQMEIQTIE